MLSLKLVLFISHVSWFFVFLVCPILCFNPFLYVQLYFLLSAEWIWMNEWILSSGCCIPHNLSVLIWSRQKRSKQRFHRFFNYVVAELNEAWHHNDITKHKVDIITKTIQVSSLHAVLVLYFWYFSQTRYKSFLDTLYTFITIFCQAYLHLQYIMS